MTHTIKTALIVLLICFSEPLSGQNPGLYSFKADKRIFMSYAFINAGGYDFDHAEYHPMRREIRTYLETTLSQETKGRIGRFMDKTGLNWTDCAEYAVYLSMNELTWLCQDCGLELKEKYAGLDELYRAFSQEAEIDELWSSYQPRLDSINALYQPYAELAISHITHFCKISDNYYADQSIQLHYMKMPLISHFTAFTFDAMGHMYIIDGPPLSSPGPDTYYHEALHPALGKIIDVHEEKIQSFGKMNELARAQLQGNYNDTKELFEESIVRVIDIILRAEYYKKSPAETLASVEVEYKRGYIFSFYLYEKLLLYQQSSETLEDFFPKIIGGLNLDKEISRYRDFWKTHKDSR